MSLELKTHPRYNPEEVAEFFTGRGWEVEYVRASNEELVEAEKGLAVQCIDGRMGKNQKIKGHGPKLPGGVYSIAALKTGGDIIGFNAAAALLRKLGYRAGTHVDCAFLRLWMKGDLLTVRHRLALPGGLDPKKWVPMKHKQWEGEHFGIAEEHREHEEEALVFNPFVEVTSQARRDRFGYDHGLMQVLGVPARRAMHLVAETVEKASHRRKIEILTK
ncbi:hypothetical protein HYU95_00635 [Candidatus Daviesbacteria bacterium]|nr:hypothetical protein [Candidatus Daviesbacteria bacterium]